MTKAYKFSERAAQKQVSREADAARMASGRLTGYKLSKEGAFVKGGGFRGKQVGFARKYPSEAGCRYHTPDGQVGKRIDTPDPQGATTAEPVRKSDN